MEWGKISHELYPEHDERFEMTLPPVSSEKARLLTASSRTNVRDLSGRISPSARNDKRQNTNAGNPT
jgi:hypothetical protein